MKNDLMPPMFCPVDSRTTSLTIMDIRVQYDGGDTTDAAACARVLQGLVNRKSEDKLYLYNDCTDTTHDVGGKYWNVQRAWREAAGELNGLPVKLLDRVNGHNGGLHGLLDRYLMFVKGVVIWDPNTLNKVNMATFGAAVTIASQKEGLAVSPGLKDEIETWGFRFPVLEDLREHKFKHDHEVLDWSIDNFWSGSNHDIKAVFSLGMDGWAPFKDWGDNWLSNYIFNEGPIDYAVAVNGFSFNINMSDYYDDHVLMKLMHKYPEGQTAVLGWIPTHPFQYGFSEMPTCLNGTSYFVIGVNGFSNMSVFASFTECRRQLACADALDAGDNDVFINFIVTDGDALHCVYRGMFSAFLSRRGDFGEVPVTWTINPVLTNLAPPVFNYFSDNLPECSDFAIGFANKVHTPWDTGLEGMAYNWKLYRELSGIDIMWTVHSEEDSAAADICDWKGIITGYANSRIQPALSLKNEAAAVWGTWTFEGNLSEDIAEGIRDEASKHPGKPIFMSVLLGAAFSESPIVYSRAKAVKKLLDADHSGRKYHFVNAKDMAATILKYMAD